MAEAGEQLQPLSRFQKMTRSISFKLPGSFSKEHSHTHSTRPHGPRPKKLDAESWVKKRQNIGTRHIKETPPDMRNLGASIGDKKSLWAAKVDSHAEKQALNPFSEKFDPDKLKSMLTNKDDPNYARPDPTSLSAMRAAAGEAKMRSDICDVCDVVYNHGQRTPDGLAAIQFGPLFSIYNRINDKLVGLLIRARRRDLLHFEGEMLYQNRDDEKWVVLSKNLNTIHAYFGRDSTVVGGGEVESEMEGKATVFRSDSRDSRCSSMDDSRKASICSLPAACVLSPSFGRLAVAAVTAGPEIKLHAPSLAGEERDSFPDLTAKSQEAPPPRSPTKISAKGLRNSFRKLVKPLVKKRNPELEEREGEESPEPPSGPCSRRGSVRRSAKTCGLPAAASCATLPGVEEPRAGAEARWKKVLGVSMAIGRMARLASSHPEAGEPLSRRGSVR